MDNQPMFRLRHHGKSKLAPRFRVQRLIGVQWADVSLPMTREAATKRMAQLAREAFETKI